MADKPRIVLQFKDCDFRHRKAMEILQAHSRTKTDFVVNALLHYISCPDAQNELSRDNLRKIIREVIEEMQAEGSLGTIAQTPKSSSVPPDAEELGDLMSAFRGR